MTTITFDGKVLDQPQPQTKQAIVGTLPVVEAMIRQFIDELDPRERLTMQLTFNRFVFWARKKVEAEGRVSDEPRTN